MSITKNGPQQFTQELEDGKIWVYATQGGGWFLQAKSSIDMRGVSLRLDDMQLLIVQLRQLIGEATDD